MVMTSVTDSITLEQVVHWAIEAVALLGGAAGLMYKLGSAMEKFEQIAVQQTRELSDLKTEVVQMRTIVGQIAIQTQRIDSLEARFDTLDKRLYDLSCGEGFRLPLTNRVIESK